MGTTSLVLEPKRFAELLEQATVWADRFVSKSRKEWLNSLKTSDQPYLRLALVRGSRDGKGKR